MSSRFEGSHLSGIEAFCLVAKHEGFTAAARSIGQTTAAVSRTVSKLEARLGVRLLSRTTRQVKLTAEGRRFYEQCRLALNQLDDAEREITGQQLSPAGVVRLSLPTSYGHFRILPSLKEFMDKYPEIKLDIQMTNRNVNLTEDLFDIAIRARNHPDSGLVARKLEDAELVTVASPEYFKGLEEPKTYKDLDAHSCIQFKLPSTGVTVPWQFVSNGQIVDVVTTGKVMCSEDILAPITLALAGVGIAQTYKYLVDDHLKEKRLIEVLASEKGASRPFSIIYKGNKNLPARVRVLIDYIIEKFSKS